MISPPLDPVDFAELLSAARVGLPPTAAAVPDSPSFPLSPTLSDSQARDPSFCMTEDALSRIEAALRVQEKRRIPRAGQLSHVSRLPAAECEGSSQNPRPPSLSFRPSPSLAPDRVQSQVAATRRRFNVGAVSIILIGAVSIILIAGAVTAALAHYFYTGEISAEPAVAKVLTPDLASLPAPSLVDAQINHRTIDEATDQGEDKSKAGKPIEPPVSDQKSAASAASPPNMPARNLTLHPRLGKPSTSVRAKLPR
jgi:hypothetical protein